MNESYITGLFDSGLGCFYQTKPRIYKDGIKRRSYIRFRFRFKKNPKYKLEIIENIFKYLSNENDIKVRKIEKKKAVIFNMSETSTIKFIRFLIKNGALLRKKELKSLME